MSQSTIIHVVLWDDTWVVRRDDIYRAMSVHDTQREAVDVARKIARAKKGQLVIHRREKRGLEISRRTSVRMYSSTVRLTTTISGCFAPSFLLFTFWDSTFVVPWKRATPVIQESTRFRTSAGSKENYLRFVRDSTGIRIDWDPRITTTA